MNMKIVQFTYLLLSCSPKLAVSIKVLVSNANITSSYTNKHYQGESNQVARPTVLHCYATGIGFYTMHYEIFFDTVN